MITETITISQISDAGKAFACRRRTASSTFFFFFVSFGVMALLDSSFPTVTCSNFLLKRRASMPVTGDSFLTQIRRVRSFITIFVLFSADRRVSSTHSVTLYHSTVSLAAPQRRLRLVAILRFRKPPMVYYPLSISGFTSEVTLLPFSVSLTGEHIASCSYRCVSLYQPSLIISTVSFLSKKTVLLVKVDISFRRGNSPSSRTVFGLTTDPLSPPFISISRLDPSNPQDARRVQSQPRVRSSPPAWKASLALVGVSTFNLRILWIASKIFCRGRVETLIEMGQILISWLLGQSLFFIELGLTSLERSLMEIGLLLFSWFLGQCFFSLILGLTSIRRILMEMGQILLSWFLSQCLIFLLLGQWSPGRPSCFTYVLVKNEKLYLQRLQMSWYILNVQSLDRKGFVVSISSIKRDILSFSSSWERPLPPIFYFCGKSVLLQASYLESIILPSSSLNDNKSLVKEDDVSRICLLLSRTFVEELWYWYLLLGAGIGYFFARSLSRLTCDLPFQGLSVSALQAQVWNFKITRNLNSLY